MTTVIISYNSVNGFASGWHGDQRLFVCANDADATLQAKDDRTARERAGTAMHRISGNFYRGTVPVENVDVFFIYAGLNALEAAISMAKDLSKQAPRATVTVFSCRCDCEKKAAMLRGTPIGMLTCECGGRATLSKLAHEAIRCY